MSTKKVIAIVLFVLQGLGLVGALMSGSMYMQFSILSWFGFFLFGIVGGILIYLDGKDKKTKPTHTENSGIKTETSLDEAKSYILNELMAFDIYFFNDSTMTELLDCSTFTRTGKIDKNLLDFNIEIKRNELLNIQSETKNLINTLCIQMQKNLTGNMLKNILFQFCVTANKPEGLIIMENAENKERFLKRLIVINSI